MEGFFRELSVGARQQHKKSRTHLGALFLKQKGLCVGKSGISRYRKESA